MAAQFAHISTFSRKPSSLGKGKAWGVGDIAREAGRDPSHIPHVLNPQPPVQIAGNFPVSDLENELEKFLESKSITVNLKGGKTAQRKVKSDAHVLAASVYSWPEHIDEFSPEKAQAFFDDCLKFHAEKIGEVACAVVHFDEAFPHVHVYTFAANAREIHPGWKAKNDALKAGESGPEANAIYKKTMADFQTDFFQSVGLRHGLDRLGPKRQRLSRSEWSERKQALAKIAVAQEQMLPAVTRLDEVKKEGRETVRALDKATQKLKTLNDQIEQETAKLERARVEFEAIERKIQFVEKVGGTLQFMRHALYKIMGRELPEVAEAKAQLLQVKTREMQLARELAKTKTERDTLQSAYTEKSGLVEKLRVEVGGRDLLLDERDKEIQQLKNPQPSREKKRERPGPGIGM
jgi:hypothetical protein